MSKREHRKERAEDGGAETLYDEVGSHLNGSPDVMRTYPVTESHVERLG
jgi:hypothetical protein